MISQSPFLIFVHTTNHPKYFQNLFLQRSSCLLYFFSTTFKLLKPPIGSESCFINERLKQPYSMLKIVVPSTLSLIHFSDQRLSRMMEPRISLKIERFILQDQKRLHQVKGPKQKPHQSAFQNHKLFKTDSAIGQS